jgi:hypothetical protein
LQKENEHAASSSNQLLKLTTSSFIAKELGIRPCVVLEFPTLSFFSVQIDPCPFLKCDTGNQGPNGLEELTSQAQANSH